MERVPIDIKVCDLNGEIYLKISSEGNQTYTAFLTIEVAKDTVLFLVKRIAKLEGKKCQTLLSLIRCWWTHATTTS